MRFGLKCHAVRSLLLGDYILAKVECLTGGHAVRLRGDGVYDVSGLCTQGSVRGVNILRSSDIKDCARKSGILIYRPEDGSLVYNAAEDLAGLLDADDAFCAMLDFVTVTTASDPSTVNGTGAVSST